MEVADVVVVHVGQYDILDLGGGRPPSNDNESIGQRSSLRPQRLPARFQPSKPDVDHPRLRSAFIATQTK